MQKFLFLLSASSVAAVGMGMSDPAYLFARQVEKVPCAEQGYSDCGDGCIYAGWSCCPSKDRGCPPTKYCALGSNNEYGCCDNGKVCVGDGGATTLKETQTLVNTLTVPVDTSTIVQESTTVIPPSNTDESTTVIKQTSTTVLTISDTLTLTRESTTAIETTIKGTLTSPTPVSLPTVVTTATPPPAQSGGSGGSTGGGSPPPASTSSIAIVNAGAANGYSGSGIVGGLLAGVLALLL